MLGAHTPLTPPRSVTTMYLRSFAILCLASLLVVPCLSRPYRQKRPSDQRLQELQTLLELSQMKGGIVTLPVGLGLDPEYLGRKRRSSEALLQDLLDSREERGREEEDSPRWLQDV